MEPSEPNDYRTWTYEELLAEVKLARAEFARPDKTVDEGVKRAWWLELLDHVEEHLQPSENRDKLRAYRNGMEPTPVEEPSTSAPYAVVKAIYREAWRRDVVPQLAIDLGLGSDFYAIITVARIPVDIGDETS